ncbi:glycoside hydrolase superfamily [Fomes fomentarius]|nr:glycoside hydrolase superfamily [Fomes fomentarius]
MPQNAFQPLGGQLPSFPVDISALYDNRAFGMTPNEANFDGAGGSYPAQSIPPSTFVYSGFNYSFPEYRAAGNDNLIAVGQHIPVPHGKYLSVAILAASESSIASSTINASYADGSQSSDAILVPAWWNWPYPAGGDIVLPYRFTNTTVDYNRTNIFQAIGWLDSTKELTALTLPNVTGGSSTAPGGGAVGNRLHIFALSLLPAPLATDLLARPRLVVQYARATQKWLEGSNKTQIFEVTIDNVGSEFVLRSHSVTVWIESPGVETIKKATVRRLRNGDQVVVEIGVVNKPGVEPGTSGNATVYIAGTAIPTSQYTFNATFGIAQYESTYDSIYSHEAPSWYNDAKYGIFIHWGVYSVPGWGNVGKNESYAEWYWWDLNKGPGTSVGTYERHLATYGPDVVYDDFIQNFTASAFDPKAWVDLFADAGANYFVQVSKHHDGYAIFDLPANVSQRTSVALPPHRNLLQELFDAAERYQPHLHKGVYFSLPEWFHPDYAKYGFDQWPGGNATNPFTNETLSYTGYVPVEDFITDVITPEMNTLADMGIEILWCDIGGPNMTAEWASSWYNAAASRNRQVTMNARCGLPGDFDTPEYARYAGVQARKWESNLGMDPFSYGYNRATPSAAYMNASAIVTSLVDIVSKNGNFLLDVGPMANGTILEVEQKNLREAGMWIKSHAEAVFGTRFWGVTPQEGESLRFMTSEDAFYVLVLDRPEGRLVIESPVPWVQGDKVTIVGGYMAGAVVPSWKGNGRGVVLEVSKEVADADEFVWVFKITY